MGSASAGDDTAKKRVLVVEDEALIAHDLAQNLDSRGLTPIGPIARLGASLAALAQEAPDGAILDVMLGSEAVWPLARMLAARGVPFVIITGDASQSDWPRDVTPVAVVTKPFSNEALEAGIAALRAAMR